MSKVCFCKGIEEEVIVKAIEDGAKTFEEVKEKTGAGSGACCGGRCKSTILELIKK